MVGLALGVRLGAIVPGPGGIDYSLNGVDFDAVADFRNSYFRVGGSETTFASMFTFSRASTATYIDSSGTIQTAASGVARVANHVWNGSSWVSRGMLKEYAATNQFLNSGTLSTQGVTTLAQAYTVSFTGTGTITFSGAHTGSLVGTGTGEENRVSTTFTAAAGTVTCTVSGTVSNAQFEGGQVYTSYIPTTGATVTRAADSLDIAAANLPWSATERSYTIDGTLSFADEGDASQVTFINQQVDASNRIRHLLATNSTNTGAVTYQHTIGGTTASRVGTGNQYTPGQDVAFNLASRHTATVLQGSVDGVALGARATTGLVDLSAADLSVCPSGFAGNIGLLRVADADIGQAGLEATA